MKIFQVNAFIHLKYIFPIYLSDAKLTVGIFKGPQIREFIKNVSIEMNTKELKARVALKILSNTFVVTKEVIIISK